MDDITSFITPTRLFSHIEEYGDAVALFDLSGEPVTYKALLSQAAARMQGLETTPTLIAIEASNDLIPLSVYVGALRAGHVVLLATKEALVPDSEIQKVYRPRYICSFSHGTWEITENERAPRHALHKDLAVLLSTSGSTGNPKLVRLSHRNLISNAAAISAYLRLSSDECAAMTLPWSYSYGLSIINTHLLMGATILLSKQSVSDPAFWSCFNRHRATSFAGVPYTFDLLERSGFFSRELPSLRYFTQAGGRLAPGKVLRFADYAERRNIRFYVMYGQTEATARIAYMPPSLLKRYPDHIGRAIPEGGLSLVDEHGREIGEGNRKGELVYTGENVMMGYATQAADLARGHELGRLCTGDIAVRNSEGLYKIVGRLNRFAKILGLRINLDDVESVLENEGIAAKVAGDDTGIVIAVKDMNDSWHIRESISRKFKLPLSSLFVFELEETPRLSTGKLDYAALLRSGRKQLEGNLPSENELTLRQEIAECLGISNVTDNDSFISLGGNSINYAEVSMLLEKRLGWCPKRWEYMPLRQLEASSRVESSWLRRIDMDVLFRAFAIIAVVFHHASAMPMGGAATTLLIIGGYNFARFFTPRLISGEFSTVIRPVLSSIIPIYFSILTIYFVVTQSLFVPQYLFVSNFTEGFFLDGNRVLSTFWFIESYLWLILLSCIVFRLRRARNMASLEPWRFSLMILVSTLLLRGIGENLPEYRVFNSQTPFMIAYIFAIGWCVFTSRSLKQKLVTTGFIVVTLGALFQTGSYLYIVAPISMLWVPSMMIEKWAQKVLTLISGASLHIYMTHGLVIHSVREIMGGSASSRFWPVVVPVCIIFGIATWKSTDRNWLKYLLSGKRKYALRPDDKSTLTPP